MAVALTLDVYKLTDGTIPNHGEMVNGSTTEIAIDENIAQGTRIAEIKGWENTNFGVGGPVITWTNNPGGLFDIEMTTINGVKKWFLIAKTGAGLAQFDYEDENWLGIYPQIGFKVTASGSTTTVHQGSFQVDLNDLPESSNHDPDSLAFTNGQTAATVNENSAGATLGILQGHDPDTGDTLTYGLAPNGDPSGKFEVVGGVLKLKDGVSLDYENSGANHQYSVTVRVSDNHGGFKDQAFTINVANVNENPGVPTLTASGTGTTGTGADAGKVLVNETAGTGEIATLSATDPDGDALGYSLANTFNGLFGISNGKLVIADASKLPVNADTDYSITVNVSDGRGGTSSQTFTIKVKDVATPNQNPDSLTFENGTVATAISENDAGARIGFLRGHDPDTADNLNLTYALAPNGDPSGKFEVVSTPNGWVLKLINGVSLDYENSGANHAYTVTVRVSDGRGGFKDQAFVVNVTDVTETPGNRTPDKLTFANDLTTATAGENEAGASIGVLRGHDPDPSDTLSYALAPNGDSSGKFEVVNGVLKLKDGVSLDYENSGPNHAYTVKVRVTDQHGDFLDQTFTINVGDKNEFPIVSGAPIGTVQELAARGTSVATLSATDPDGDALSYSLVVNGVATSTDGRFYIEGNQIKVANGVMLDYEQATSHQLTVRVSDGKGGIKDTVMTIGVTDLAPEVMSAATASPLNDIIKASLTGNFKDVFFGGDGNDTLYGGYGNDTLTGGFGNDVFVFNSKLGTSKTDRKVNFDKITDFKVGQDKLWLDNAIFKKLGKKGTELAPAKLDKKFFALDKAKDSNDYLIYNKKTGVLSYDADGSGKGAAIEIAQLAKNLKMTYKDFFVI